MGAEGWVGVQVEVRSVILQWVELSHYVVRDRLLATALKPNDDLALARKIEAE